MIPNKYVAILTYSMMLLAAFLAFGKYKEDRGWVYGRDFAVAQQQKNDHKVEAERQAEKEHIESEYQKKIDLANASRDRLAGDIERLRAKIANVRGVVTSNTGAKSCGNAASQSARVLAGLFDESVQRNNALANEAERYRIAGETCQKQYQSLRGDK